MVNYTLKQLRYFSTVAKLGSVKLASEELHISQPAISNAVAQLEDTLGLQLLIRQHARGVELTPSGQQFLTACRGLLAHSEEVLAESRDLANAMSGVLSIGCFSTLGPFILPRLLREFNRVCPEVTFRTSEGNIAELQDSLIKGKTEVAILYDLSLDDRLESTVVAELYPHAIVSKRHKLAKRKSVRLDELVGDPMVLLDLPHSREYFKTIFDSFGLSPQIKHSTNNFESVRSFVANDRGFSLLNIRPAFNRTYDGSQLSTLEIKDDVHSLKVVVARLRDLHGTRRMKAFHDFCVSEIAPLLET